jgi:hypothetical protein
LFHSFESKFGLVCVAGHWFCGKCGFEGEDGIGYCRSHAYLLEREIKSGLIETLFRVVGDFFFGFVKDESDISVSEPCEPDEHDSFSEKQSLPNQKPKSLPKRDKGGNRLWTPDSDKIHLPNHNPDTAHTREYNKPDYARDYMMANQKNEYSSPLESLKKKLKDSY